MLACSDFSPANVAVAAGQAGFLVTFDTSIRAGARALVARLDEQGRLLADPVGIAGRGSLTRVTGTSRADGVVAGDDGFYVSWTESVGFVGGWRGRRVDAAGSIANQVDDIERFPGPSPGMCGPSYLRGPLGVAMTLDGTGIHHTVRFGQRCGLEGILGVPFEFRTYPMSDGPQILETTSGPGRLARGAHDVAALWWVNELPFPVEFVPLRHVLYAGWIEPDPAALPLVEVASDFAGDAGLAALGDQFLAAYASAGEVRALRFARAPGVADEPPGILLANGQGEISGVAAASNGEGFVVAWRAPRPGGMASIRLVRLGADGAVLDPEPLEVVSALTDEAFGIASTDEAVVIVYAESNRPNPDGSADASPVAVRLVTIPN